MNKLILTLPKRGIARLLSVIEIWALPPFGNIRIALPFILNYIPLLLNYILSITHF
jgi:hypothetical protein